MKSVSVFVLGMALATLSFAAEPRCQKAVERQEKGLAAESSANPENKNDIMRRMREDEFVVDEAQGAEIAQLLRREDTLAFTFQNDAGIWLSIADGTNRCEVLLTIQIVEF